MTGACSISFNRYQGKYENVKMSGTNYTTTIIVSRLNDSQLLICSYLGFIFPSFFKIHKSEITIKTFLWPPVKILFYKTNFFTFIVIETKGNMLPTCSNFKRYQHFQKMSGELNFISKYSYSERALQFHVLGKFAQAFSQENDCDFTVKVSNLMLQKHFL